MNKHPFKVQKGGQAEPVAAPQQQFEGFDYKAYLRAKIKAEHIADRNKAILAERAKMRA